ncbi:hypothetical protein AgCh_032857 [Apium graveolens]
MMMFMKASNPLYIGILLNDPYVPREVVAESSTPAGIRIPSTSTPRVLSKYTETDKELINLDTSLQLIIVESIDNDMGHQLLGIYLEQKNTSIREKADFITTSMDMIYGKLRTHELEQKQRAIIYGSGSVDSKSTELVKTTALVAREPETQEVMVAPSSIIKEIIVAEISYGEPEDESEFYSQEELEDLEIKFIAYMAGKFSHVRFRRKPNYKSRGLSGRFQKGSYSSGSSSIGGYKSSWVDKSKTRCYICNELGHFASDCRKPKAEKGKDSYEKKETYEDLKRYNEEEEYVNLALMADSAEESPESSQKEIIDSQIFKSKTSIGLDYSKLTKPLDEISLLINEEMIAEDRERKRKDTIDDHKTGESVEVEVKKNRNGKLSKAKAPFDIYNPSIYQKFMRDK